MKYLISGGFGDCINQLAKAISCRKENNHVDIEMVYIRDSIDEQILDNAKSLTRDYASWVEQIAKINGFEKFSVIVGDQKKLCEQLYNETVGSNIVIFGPNMNYDLKIFEQQRGLYIGTRPFEKEYVPQFPVNWVYEDKKLSDKSVLIQVRFAVEYPTKIPNASWKDLTEILLLVNKVKEKGYEPILIGETQIQGFEKFSRICGYNINCPALEAYDLILSAKYLIGFSGFFSNIALTSGKPILRMMWDEAEYHLQTHNDMKKYVTHFDHNNLFQQLDTFLQ